MLDPDFLTVEDVLGIHARGLADHGGTDGVRDDGLLASAVAMPQARFGGQWAHDDLFEMAANGVDIDAAAEGRLYDAMIAVSARKMTKRDLGRLLRELASRP